jgi:hypothetical protein
MGHAKDESALIPSQEFSYRSKMLFQLGNLAVDESIGSVQVLQVYYGIVRH